MKREPQPDIVATPDTRLPVDAPNPRAELHTLIEMLPDSLLFPLRDLLVFVHQNLLIPGVFLLVDALHVW